MYGAPFNVDFTHVDNGSTLFFMKGLLPMNFRLIQQKITLPLVSALIGGVLVAISIPTTANAIAPVGAASSNAFLINGIPTGGIGVATINSASAVALTDAGATAVARSVGLAVYSATSTSQTYQAATVEHLHLPLQRVLLIRLHQQQLHLPWRLQEPLPPMP